MLAQRRKSYSGVEGEQRSNDRAVLNDTIASLSDFNNDSQPYQCDVKTKKKKKWRICFRIKQACLGWPCSVMQKAVSNKKLRPVSLLCRILTPLHARIPHSHSRTDCPNLPCPTHITITTTTTTTTTTTMTDINYEVRHRKQHGSATTSHPLQRRNVAKAPRGNAQWPMADGHPSVRRPSDSRPQIMYQSIQHFAIPSVQQHSTQVQSYHN